MREHDTAAKSDDQKKTEPPLVHLGKADPPSPHNRQAHRNDSPWSALAMITQLGLVVALCIVGSVVGGVYIDRLVGSNGIAVLIMIPVGLGAAAMAAWQIIRQEIP